MSRPVDTRVEPDVPAVAGGAPVRNTMLPYGQQWIDEDDIRAVVEALRSPWITRGPAVSAFEEAFAERTGAKFAVAVANGTAALHAAAHALGIGPGDEVITTPLTFAATANAILYAGGRPVFADVRPDTYNIDPDCVEACITERTRAIFSVDFTGQPVDYDALAAIAERHGLALVSDAAHAVGATYRGRPVGSLAAMTTFSLHPVKQITSGEGGVITTNDPDLFKRLRLFRNHGITRDSGDYVRDDGSWYYEMQVLGYNYHITDLQCALGRAQLRKLDQFLNRRRYIASVYNDAFADLESVVTPYQPPWTESAWHLYVIRLRLDRLRVGRREIFEALLKENIGVNVHYIPVYFHPYYASLGYGRGLCPVAEDLYRSFITLPLFPKMTDSDVQDVITAVKRVIRYYTA